MRATGYRWQLQPCKSNKIQKGDAMKAISIRNPFAHMILCGEKEFEFRTWKTDYRGSLLICSSANPKIKDTICGHALCVAQLKEVFEVTPKNYKEFGLDEKPEGKLYAWWLTDVSLVEPFPVKGKLSFYDVDDNLINVIVRSDDNLTEEEAEAICKKYIEPKLYKG